MDLEEMHIHYKNLCLVSSASSANFYSSLYEGDFEIDGSLIPDFFQFPLPKLPNISTITHENKINNKHNKNKTQNRKTRKDKRKKKSKKITTQAFHFLYLK